MINYKDQLLIELTKLIKLNSQLMLRVEDYSVDGFCTFILSVNCWESRCLVNAKDHLDNPKHLAKQLVKKLAYDMYLE